MKQVKQLYYWLAGKADKFLLRLWMKQRLWLLIPLAAGARRFFLREFSAKKKNYRTLDDLKQLVISALDEPTREQVKNYAKGSIPEGLRALMIFPKYINNSNEYIETNFEETWVRTAKDAGIDVVVFHADRISYLPPSASNSETIDREGKQLLDKVKNFRPELIFLDLNYLGNRNTINCDLLDRIKKTHPCKMAGHIGDYHGKPEFEIVEYWSRSVDVILHSSPGTSTYNLQNFHYLHYFVNEKSFYAPAAKRTDVSFSGSANIARYLYLAFALSISRQRGYKCAINGHNNSINTALTPEEYAGLIRDSRAVINLSVKPSTVRYVSGRVLQAIASKSLLIEERNEPITQIFTPYRHFIPFDSKEELAIAIEFSVQCSDLVDRITEAAYMKYLHEHSSKIGWGRILRLCDIEMRHARNAAHC
jgi:hypothetical protein